MDPTLAYGNDFQEERSHEFQQLLQSLPMEKGWVPLPARLYQYQGFWYTPKELQSIMVLQQQFQARDTDVILATAPKSGTTWLKAIVFAIMNRNRYKFSNHPLLATNPHGLVPFLEFDAFYSKKIPDLSDLPSPRIFATHVPYSSLPGSIATSNCRIVYLCRNPKDTLVSMWHFLDKYKPESLGLFPLEEAHELFCKGISPFGPFWDHALGYWKESLERPHKVLFMKYEEMKEDITSQIKKLAEHMGSPFSLEEESGGVIEEIARVCSFKSLTNLEVNMTGKTSFGGNKILAMKGVEEDPEMSMGGRTLLLENSTFFRKGVVGDCLNHFTPSMIERLDHVIEQKLEGSGLSFHMP